MKNCATSYSMSRMLMNEKDKDMVLQLQREKIEKQQKLINALEQEIELLKHEIRVLKDEAFLNSL